MPTVLHHRPCVRLIHTDPPGKAEPLSTVRRARDTHACAFRQNSAKFITTPLTAETMPTDENDRERFEREIECTSCDGKPTRLRAWADLNGLDRMEVESIAELSDDDVRRLASYGEGGIEGQCDPCAETGEGGGTLADLGGAAPDMASVPRRHSEGRR